LKHLIWLTGLPNAGKTTVAQALIQECTERFQKTPISLDGDVLRRILCMDHVKLNKDREKLGLVYVNLATELVSQGNIVVVSAVAMYKEVFARLLDQSVPTSIFFLDVNRNTRIKRDEQKQVYDARDLAIEDLVSNLPIQILKIPNNTNEELYKAVNIIMSKVTSN
jgi:adenylylsulfate kinase-like enzyme